MNYKQFLLSILMLLLHSGSIKAQSTAYTDDQKIYTSFKDQLRLLYDQGEHTPLSDFTHQLTKDSYFFTPPVSEKTTFNSPKELYQQGIKATLIVGRLFQTHDSEVDRVYTASAFLITSNGICVTNHHVFEKLNTQYKDMIMGVMDYAGNCYKIIEVLAANENDDIALFKIDTQDSVLPYLSLGDVPEVASTVHVIGHPKGMYYHYSKGVVSRRYLYKAENSERISITADFAVGSSGGPVLNDFGQVVGMVASTYPIPDARRPQMITKEIIPVSSIKKLFKD